ncbi:Uncharacterized protein FWK35_00011044 [Aphis craccivora]|uniref:Uncharacterized protein n=1 Tax=Aphis craccivora TaxID=307492 RepID=A0A6G0YBI7_APHCR|nr:Uncharacterized protein FWK35_00011044 [Aphis craccivora]
MEMLGGNTLLAYADDIVILGESRSEFFSCTFYDAVGYSSNHYVAYVRRSHGKWKMHNDLFKKITNRRTPDLPPDSYACQRLCSLDLTISQNCNGIAIQALQAPS